MGSTIQRIALGLRFPYAPLSVGPTGVTGDPMEDSSSSRRGSRELFSELLSSSSVSEGDMKIPYAAVESRCFAKGDRSVVGPGAEAEEAFLHSRDSVSIVMSRQLQQDEVY